LDKEVHVPSFRRRASVLDADRVEKAPDEPDRATNGTNATRAADAESLAEEAEAEAAEAEAIAAAARARAKAIRLRRAAQAAEEVPDIAIETDQSDTAVEAADIAADTEADDAAAVEVHEVEPARRRRWTLGRILISVAAALAVLCTCALIAASVFMFIAHRNVVADQRQSAEYAAAGRQSVVTLMSLDYNKAQEDVQRIIDNSIGQFKDDFQNQSADFVKVAQESKVITEVTVNSVAVESMSDDSAVVLVAATSRVTNTAGANQEPRSWRLSVDLQRDGGQIKMSKVEFVP
jgi:Mce-associated membrane protein